MTADTPRLLVSLEETTPPVLVLTGELDPSTAASLDAAVDQALRTGSSELVIDMAGVSFVDSSGLRSLISAHKRLAPSRLQLRRPTPFALQLLSITGLDDQFTIDPGAD